MTGYSSPSGGNGYEPVPGDLSLNWEDLKMIAEVNQTRRDSLLVRDWWHAREAAGDLAEVVNIAQGLDHNERAFGFFDTATLGDRALPVMGVMQEMFYDRQKKASLEHVREQLREFVLGFFMRVSHWQQPGTAAAGETRPLPMWLKPLSWIPESSDGRIGFGYEQLIARRRDSGQTIKFDQDGRGAIVDLRSIGSDYEWIAMRVNLFDFKITMAPFGANALRLEFPMKETTYLLVTPELIVDRDHPSPDVLGEYGYGYGLLPYTPDHTIFAYGPGKFAAGFQSFVFQLLNTGEIRAKAVFVVNRPDKILSVDIDPVDWGFKIADMLSFNLASITMGPLKTLAKQLPLRVSDIDPVSLYINTANLMSGGLAERQFGISKFQLEKHMLQRHFLQHRQMLLTSQLAWRMVADWTDREALPEFCHRGLPAEAE